jgi:hypothetical protein
MVLITRPRLVYWSALGLILLLNITSIIVSWNTADFGREDGSPKDAVPDAVAIYAMISSVVCVIAFLLAAWITPQPDVGRCQFACCMINRCVIPRDNTMRLCGGALLGGAWSGLNGVLFAHRSLSLIVRESLGMILIVIFALTNEIRNRDWELPATDEENIPLKHVQRQTNTHMEPVKP